MHGARIRPLPRPAARRYRLGSPDVGDVSGRVFAAAGVFGNQRFHHSRDDALS